MNRYRYSYSVLHYVHDIATREFFAVGVAVHSQEAGVLAFRLRKNLGLAGSIFDEEQVKSFRTLMRFVDVRAQHIVQTFESNVFAGNLGGSMSTGLSDYLLTLFPKDDSALQWTQIQTGLARDVSVVADRLYERYCAKYDRPRGQHKKTDQDAWSAFHKKLKDRRMDGYFSEKAIQGKNDEVKFPLAWKNGIWHCIEPVSFDLADAGAIREKAHKRAGEIVGVSDVAKEFAVYYVLTPPSDRDLQDAFDKAVGILQQAPASRTEVFTEGKETDLLDKLNTQITQHPVGLH